MPRQNYDRVWYTETGRPHVQPIVAKTASYTVDAQADLGKIFTNRGDTDAITFTLPTTAQVLAITPSGGWWCEFYAVEAFDVAVVAGTVDTMVIIGDKAADSVKLSTSGEIIGGAFRVVHDGTGWLVFPTIWDNGTIVTSITTAT
jgi:hypothetical protein